MSNFVFFNPGECPVCKTNKKKGDCRHNGSGLIFCWKTSAGAYVSGFIYRGEDRNGCSMYVREEDAWRSSVGEDRDFGDDVIGPRPTRPAKTIKQEDPEAIAKRERLFQHIRETAIRLTGAGSLSDELGEHLSLPGWVMPVLHIRGVLTTWNKRFWVMPERDASNNAIGIHLRYWSGEKLTYNARGLYVPDGWEDRDGPIVAIEGATDTLTCTAMDIAALGRPNDRGGVDALAKMLAHIPPDRDLIIVGENDQKPNGSWPGREGAIAVAGELSARLHRPVYWALPDADTKDVREWFKREALKRFGILGHQCTREQAKELGRDFIAGITARKQSQPLAHGAVGGDGASTPLPAGVAGIAGNVSLGMDGQVVTTPEERAEERRLNEQVTAAHEQARRVEEDEWKCKNAVVVFGTHATSSLGRVQIFDCRKLSCEPCFAKRKRKLYIPSLKYRVGGHAGEVWISECPRDEWDRVSAQLRRKHAEYFAVDIDQTIYVVSSAPLVNVILCREVRPDEAITWQQQKIEMMRAQSGKAIHTSRGWKLIEEQKKKDAGWHWHGIVKDAETCKEVLDEREIETIRKQDKAIWPRWWAYQFNTAGIDTFHLHKELEEGKTLEVQSEDDWREVDKLERPPSRQAGHVNRVAERMNQSLGGLPPATFDLADI